MNTRYSKGATGTVEVYHFKLEETSVSSLLLNAFFRAPLAMMVYEPVFISVLEVMSPFIFPNVSLKPIKSK